MPRIFEKNTPNHTVTTWLGSLQIQGSNRLGPFGWLRRSLSENENGIKWMYQGTPPIHGFSWHTSCLKEEFWGASHSWTNPIVWFPTIHGARLCIVSGFGWTWAHQTRGSYPTVQPKLLVLDDWRLMNAVLIPFNLGGCESLMFLKMLWRRSHATFGTLWPPLWKWGSLHGTAVLTKDVLAGAATNIIHPWLVGLAIRLE